jgi:hypothetical protein
MGKEGKKDKSPVIGCGKIPAGFHGEAFLPLTRLIRQPRYAQ